MDNKEFIEAIESLKESIDSLTTAERDRQNMDNSTDDLLALRNRMSELAASNKELIQAVKELKSAIHNQA